MARAGRVLEKKDSSLMFREISPPHGWKEDPHFHYLRLTLPGFEARDVTIHINKYGHLVVRGNKQVTEHKYISFEETFDVPNDGNLEEADGLFEDNQIYCVTIPKKKGGQTSGLVISMAHDEKINKPKPKDSHQVGPIHHKNDNDSKGKLPKNPIKVIKGDKLRQKRTLVFMAFLITMLIVAAVLIVKFRHH